MSFMDAKGEGKRNTDLKFTPSAIDPLGILGHAISIAKRLDAALGITSWVENTAFIQTTINIVGNGRRGGFFCSEIHDLRVPEFHVGISFDEPGESIPLVGRSNNTGVIWAEVGKAGSSECLGISRPLVGRVCSKSGDAECGRVCLSSFVSPNARWSN